MLDVNIEKILPVTEVRDSLNKIIDEVEATDELYVITKNGKPSAIVVGVHHLEKLTGISHKELMPDDKKTEETPPAAAPADASSQNPAPEIFPSDDLFSENANPAEAVTTPPQTDTPANITTSTPAASQTPAPENTAPSTLTPAAPTTADSIAPATPVDNAAPTADASSANNVFATPDNTTLDNSADLFGPPADAAPAAPLNPPAGPNLVSTPATSETNQSQSQTPPAAPTQM